MRSGRLTPLPCALDCRILDRLLKEFGAAFGDIENDAAAEARVEPEHVEAGDRSEEVRADGAGEQRDREERTGPAEILAQRFKVRRTANDHHADAHHGDADCEIAEADEVLSEFEVVHGIIPFDSRDFIVNAEPHEQRRDLLRANIQPTHYGKPQAFPSKHGLRFIKVLWWNFLAPMQVKRISGRAAVAAELDLLELLTISPWRSKQQMRKEPLRSRRTYP